MVYFNLLWVYLKIGLFGFGGGYAMLSLIQHEAVDVIHLGESQPWVSPTEFTDIVAISQMTPGPIGINSATYIGYVTTGNIWGSLIATIAVCLPSFVLVLLAGRFLMKHQQNFYVKSIFTGLRPVVVGLVASASLVLMNGDNFSSGVVTHSSSKIANWLAEYYKSILICAAALYLVCRTKVHPIWIIILAGVVGYFIF